MVKIQGFFYCYTQNSKILKYVLDNNFVFFENNKIQFLNENRGVERLKKIIVFQN